MAEAHSASSVEQALHTTCAKSWRDLNGSRPVSGSASPRTPLRRVQLPAAAANLSDALGDLERRKLVEAIEKHRGRKGDVARELGINRSTPYYRLKKYGLE